MILIRDASSSDLPAILAITNEAILNTTAIWSITPIDLPARAQWLHGRQAQNFPVLVAVRDGHVAGFASYGPFRPHEAYVHSVEHSLYVAPEAHGKGIGTSLLQALIDHAQAAGKHAMIGGIDAANHASLALHRRMGFEETGRMPQVGRKFDRWLDLVFMQKLI